MRYLIVFFFFSVSLSAQDTFIKIFDLDAPGGSFYSISNIEETLFLNGVIRSDDYTQQGLFFTQIDTFGNILLTQEYFDTLGTHYTLSDTRELVRTTNNDFLILSSSPSGAKGFLFNITLEGDIIFSRSYENNNGTLRFNNAIEVVGGFIILGTESNASNDYKQDTFVMKIDSEGNKIWEITYGNYEQSDHLPSMHKLENDEILLIGFLSTGYSTSQNSDAPWPDEALNKHRFLRVSSDGEILEEWESEEELRLDNINSQVRNQMQRDEEGNFIQGGRIMHLEYISPDPEPFIFYECQIIKRDIDFNILWNTPVGNHRGGRNDLYEVIQTLDNGWLGVGRNWVESEGENRGYSASFIAKVDDYGNYLWTRTDTAFYAANPDEGKIDHTLNSVVELPSGSIIATGRIENYNENPSRSYGWMIKLDKDGCLTPGCHPNLTGVNFSTLLTSFEVFPNPTSDYVKVAGKGAFSTEVYNSVGQLVLVKEDYFDSGVLDFSNLARGVYFVNIQTAENLILSKKVVKE